MVEINGNISHCELLAWLGSSSICCSMHCSMSSSSSSRCSTCFNQLLKFINKVQEQVTIDNPDDSVKINWPLYQIPPHSPSTCTLRNRRPGRVLENPPRYHSPAYCGSARRHWNSALRRSHWSHSCCSSVAPSWLCRCRVTFLFHKADEMIKTNRFAVAGAPMRSRPFGNDSHMTTICKQQRTPTTQQHHTTRSIAHLCLRPSA